MSKQQLKFGQSGASVRQLSDEQFLRVVHWSDKASAKLLEASRDGDVEAFTRRLKKTDAFSRRARRQKRARTAPSAAGFAGWSRPVDQETPLASEMVDLLEAFGAAVDRPKKKVSATKQKKSSRRRAKGGNRGIGSLERRLGGVLEGLDQQQSLSSFELLILVELLLTAGSVLAPDILFRAWRTALQAAVEMSSHDTGPDHAAEGPDQRLLALGELRFLAGILFRDVKGADKLIRDGRKSLNDDLLEWTDGDGTPRADLLERLPLWIAPLVRSSYWSKELGEPLWDDDADERFRRLLTTVAQFCRSNGRPALSNGSQRDVGSLLSWASPLAGWKKDSPALRFVSAIGGKNGRAKGARPAKRGGKSQRPVAQSDWARVACLRSDWSTDADSLVVAHHCEKPLIDLTALGTPLLEGVWDIEVAVDGKPLEFVDQWTCTCWFSDKDADYVEVQLTFDSGVQIERQLLLSRKEHFVLLADVISGADDKQIEYVSRLPLAASIEAKPDTRSRECRLTRDGRRARVFALALPDDRVLSTPGEFGVVDARLELRQKAIGGTYAPVVIDWHPDRKRASAEWKTLTVTEQRRVIKSDTASGHRLRMGDFQLFVYRSVSKSHEISRSVLGHHTSYETVVGQFDSSGEVDPIVIVE